MLLDAAEHQGQSICGVEVAPVGLHLHAVRSVVAVVDPAASLVGHFEHEFVGHVDRQVLGVVRSGRHLLVARLVGVEVLVVGLHRVDGVRAATESDDVVAAVKLEQNPFA